ncbi:MAG: hypothetical protein JWN86_4302 [Planctomycetota bacterium]|nr:hypothetical protein [Planctomycetota bacterium]
MATITTTKITADEFLKMDLGEGLHELVKGEIVVMPPPGPRHGFVCANTGEMVQDFGRTTGHGHAMSNDSVVVIDGENVRGADIQYFSEARWPSSQVGDDPPPVPPDLVVEVRSPTDRLPHVLNKVADYLRAGVPVVLLLQPKRRTVALYRDNDDDPIVLDESDVVENLPELPGFQCIVGEFFG